MDEQYRYTSGAGIFITFSGNCKKALTLYQTCFGGQLFFENFSQSLPGYPERPVVIGSLLSDRIFIQGSDLVQDEGRKIGNHIAIIFACAHNAERKRLTEQLLGCCVPKPVAHEEDQVLIEIVDVFQVRWLLSVK